MSIFSEKITRRRFLQGMAVAAGSAALAGCGGGSGSSSDEITFMNWEETEGTPLGDVLKEFEKKTGMKVTIQPAPEGDAYDAKMRTVLSSGSPPDVFRINDDFVRGFSKDGALLDLSKYMKNLDTDQFIKPSFNLQLQLT